MNWSKTEKQIAKALFDKAFAQRMKEFRALLAPKVALLENLDDVSELFSTMREKDKEWQYFIINSWSLASERLGYLYNHNYISDEDLSPFSDEKYYCITLKHRT